MPTTPSGADPKSLQQAYAAASATGRPAPVRDKTGRIIYYVDTQGTPTDKDGAPLGQPKRRVDQPKKPSAPAYKPPDYDQTSFTLALRAAQATGRPQPVLNAKGSVAFYIDQDGTPTDVDGAPLGQPKRKVGGDPKPPADPSAPNTWDNGNNGKLSPYGMANGSPMFYGNYDPTFGNRPSGKFSTENGALIGPGSLDRQQRAQVEAQRQAALAGPGGATKSEQQKGQNALAVSAANQLRGWVWVNGQLSQVVGFDKDHNPIVHFAGGGLKTTNPTTGKVTTDPTKPNQVSTAFSALDLNGSITGSEMFNLSAGPANIFTGQSNAGDGFGTPGTSYTPAGVGMTPAAAEHSQSAETVTGAIYDSNGHVTGHAPVQNQMTVAQGVQWFLNLSVQHKDQYTQLVQMLRAAHYLTDYTGNAADGGYGFDAAGAFAKAAAELSQVNSTQGGAGIGLYDFLDQKAKAAQQSAAAATQPVQRAYQDPATLRYAARQAAQTMLGRDLTPAELQAFESSYRGQENAYYNNVDATNRAQASAGVMDKAGPANTVAAPDTTGEADNYVRGDQFNNERAGYSMLEYLKAFEGFIKSGSL